jgi:alkaline phosphatase D
VTTWTTRTTLLALVLAAAAAHAQTATPAPASGLPADALRSGPMLAYGDLRETALWIQTRHAADAQLRFHPEGRPAEARLTEVVRTNERDDLIAVFTLSGLEPGTRYAYEVYLDGRAVARPYPFTFATQALWRWRTDPPDFTAMFGSCAYVNDPAYDRPGTPYGSDHEIFEAMAAQKPDLMLWVGDNTYTREVDFFSPAGIRYRYGHTRALPQLQPFLAATHHYATWDDHDYGPNDSDATFPLKDVSLDVFKKYWPNVAYGLRETPGVFHKFQWNDVDFFLVDDRYYRKPESWPAGPDKGMLGPVQMGWLKESLAASRAPFKVVVVGSQALNPLSRSESWAEFETERTELLDFIRDARVEGVLFLSGDRHMTELIRIERPGAYPLFDFTSSPLTAGTAAPRGPELLNPHRVAGTLLVEHSFAQLRFEGKPGARRVRLSAYDKTGNLKWEQVIAQGDLAFPKPAVSPR